MPAAQRLFAALLAALTLTLAAVAAVVVRPAAGHVATVAESADVLKPTFTMTGNFTLIDASLTLAADGSWECYGDGGYDDITEGAQVTVYDQAGQVIAMGHLGVGMSGGGCTFPITVKDVPSGRDFYQVEVSHRGKVTVTAQEAETGVSFSLG